MKLDRLFGILAVLLERERVPAKELAQRFEVSERTIYRDIAALEQAGMPVVTYAGSGGGIGILPGYKLDRQLLSHRDMAAIGAGLSGLSSLGGDRAVKDLMQKLLPGEGGLSPQSDILIDFSSWDSSRVLERRIALLRRCIADSRCVEMEYLSAGGRQARTVEPWKIVFKANSWYLYAYCRLRGEPRLFKLRRITRLAGLEEACPDRGLPRTPPLSWGNDAIADRDSGEGEPVRLRFSPGQAYLVIDIFGPDGYVTLPDGALEADFRSTDLEATLYMVLGFGPDVEVLEPSKLRGMLAQWAEDILRRHRP